MSLLLRSTLFNRTVPTQLPVLSQIHPTNNNTQQIRYASSKQLRIRMNAVNNIKKITKAMKMVASAKLRKSEEALKIARSFAKSFDDILPANEVAIVDAQYAEPPKEASGKQYLVLALSADRGLCGSVNGQLIRNVKYKLNSIKKATDNTLLMVYGEKAKSGLERGYVKGMYICHMYDRM